MRDINLLLTDIDHKTRFKSQREMVSRFKSFFGPGGLDGIDIVNSNLDIYVDLISNAKKTDAYISRTLSSILQQSLKNGWFFDSLDPKKAKRIEKRFNALLLNSNMNPRSFMRNTLKAYIDYSNVFIHKKYKEDTVKRGSKGVKDKVIAAITLFPSKGWSVRATEGPIVTKWYFNYQGNSESNGYSNENIYHLTYNKDIHETFGSPFILSVMEDVQLLRNLEGAAIEDYYKQADKRTVIYVGDQTRPGTSEEITQLSNYLDSLRPGEDLVLSNRCNVKVIESSYSEPNKIMSSMQDRVFAGLMASSTQMGISGAGRQDADTQQSRETITVEEFQENLEDQLNNTLIRELCLEEFGEYNRDSVVTLRFGKNFTQAEKSNNHYLNLYLANAIDFKELRSKIEMPFENFEESNSFNAVKEKYEFRSLEKNNKLAIAANKSSTSALGEKQEKTANLIKSKAQPENQHGKKSTSKKSIKD